MYVLEGKNLRYAINGQGLCQSVYNKLTHHEYLYTPDFTWRLIYAEGERAEIPVWPMNQHGRVTEKDNQLIFHYPSLQGDGRTLNVQLDVVYEMMDDRMSVCAHIENNDNKAQVMEIYLCPIAGVRSLCGKPEKDAVAWPSSLGRSIKNPAFSDLSVHAGFRKYEKHDQYHTDLCNTYPARLSMQWFDWYNQDEGVYVGSHDTTRRTLSLDCERDVKTNTLRMGVIHYPMLEQGETETVPPVVIAPHLGDWHHGAKIYREFMISSGLFTAPVQAEWAKDFSGWLRVILKQHHMECNWTYKDIPRLYDEAEAAGMKTIFLLGWEKGGFARMWPDYITDEGALGGKAELKKSIDYVHSKGGKVLMFLSYSLLDHESDFYKNEHGEECTIKTIWNTEVPFSETYCGEGTYRKMCNPPMPMYLSCPGSDKWQVKMQKSADYCLDMGVDGVLYDLGGLPPYFCYDKGHTHKKPSHAFESKADRFKELRRTVKKHGDDKIILMEHGVDVFNQHMDITQPTSILSRSDIDLQAMYRYTFPELILTNREHGQDEIDYRHMINQTVALGLRFDMTIWRCCGTLSDIPNYTAYLTEVNALRDHYGKYLLHGLFRDNDGIDWDNKQIQVYAYEAKDQTHAALCWNDTESAQTLCVTFANGKKEETQLPPQSICVLLDQNAKGPGEGN